MLISVFLSPRCRPQTSVHCHRQRKYSEFREIHSLFSRWWRITIRSVVLFMSLLTDVRLFVSRLSQCVRTSMWTYRSNRQPGQRPRLPAAHGGVLRQLSVHQPESESFCHILFNHFPLTVPKTSVDHNFLFLLNVTWSCSSRFNN